MADPKTLYQELILDHNRKPCNFGRLAHASHAAEGDNPLCGDHLSLELNLEDERIAAIAFEGESCAICKASASMMTAAVKGKARQDAEGLIAEFRAMATGELDCGSQAHHLGRLTVFAGVRDLPTRVKCAILPWHTLHAALHAVARTSTESDDDPMHAPIGNARGQTAMPKIAEIEDTPNPNAKKFILDEPLTWGITRSYENAGQAEDDDFPFFFSRCHGLVPICLPPRTRRRRKDQSRNAGCDGQDPEELSK